MAIATVSLAFASQGLLIQHGSDNYVFTPKSVLLDDKGQIVPPDKTAKIIYHVLDNMNFIDSTIMRRLRDCASKNSLFVSIPKSLFQEVLNNVKSSNPQLAKRLLDEYVS